MNGISEAIFQSIDVIVDKKLRQLSFDKSFESDIYSVIDADVGEYRVLYNGEYLPAFTRYPEERYQIGERVLVLVPGNEMSGRKTILGRAESQSVQALSESNAADMIIEASPTFDKLYGYKTSDDYGVVAGAPVGSDYATCEIGSWERGIYHGTFQRYANEYEYLRIQGSFLTQFNTVFTRGNYGLELTFYTNAGSTISYRLDLSAFNGDPYSLSTYSPQSIIIKIQKGYLYGLASIKLFEENFPDYDHEIEGGLPTTAAITTTPNIFVKDISIQYVELKDYSANSYYLAITTPSGNYLSSDMTSITLQGKLLFQRKDLYSSSTCACQWYIKDASTMRESAEYRKAAGIGWRPIEDATSNILALDLTSGDIWQKRDYKLIMVYNNITLSSEISVYNLTSPYEFHIEQTNSNNDFTLQLINDTTDDTLVADWFLLQPDGAYTKLTEDERTNSISLNYLAYTSAIFYANVYKENNSTLLGTLDFTITTTDFESDVTVSYSGDDTFRYDANGDVTIEDSEVERVLKPVLTWKDGVYGTGAKLRWYSVDGTYLDPDSGKISLDSSLESMIEDIRVDSDGNLHYHIRQKYRNYFDNNTLTLKVVMDDEHEYTFRKELLFIKDGDQGTNGTTFICAIRPYDEDGNKDSGYHPLTFNNTWGDPLPLRCFVYKDGEQINDDSRYSLTYSWTGIAVDPTRGSEDRIVINGSGEPAAARYVKCQVKIDSSTLLDEPIYLYALYPIDTVVGGLDISLIKMDSIPGYIKYTSSGTNAMYYNREISPTYDSVALDVESLTPLLVDIENKRLRPTGKFIFNGDTIGVIRCERTESQYINHPIVMYLDTFGNEAINGWDGTSIEIEDGHILAPQIGAGEKDSSNRFTGVIMGKDTGQKNDDYPSGKIGLFGYQDGVASFGLTQDGKAFFGQADSGGRIVIDGTTASIYGGDSTDQSTVRNGMIITLANKGIGGNQSAIRIGNSNGKDVFKVDYNGALTASSATITGVINANTGYIGGEKGWTIATNKIQSNNGSVYLSTKADEYAFYSSNFQVSQDGNMTCSNATISGTITATGGSIGKWGISNGSISCGNTTLDSSGTISTDTFTINNYGSIGYIKTGDNEGLGMLAAEDKSIIIEGDAESRFSTSEKYGLFLQSGSYVLRIGPDDADSWLLYCNIPAGKQSGIYARFA